MVAATLTPTRALRRPRRADPRALIGLCLTVVALAGSVAFWVGTNAARPVVIATRELPAGATLRSSDLAIANVHMDDGVYQAAIPGDQLDRLVGQQLSEPLHAQQVLARAQLADGPGLGPDQVAITIPAKPDSAVDGRLRAGDTVQVLVTVVDKTGASPARTRVVLDRARVYAVGHDTSFSEASSSAERQAGVISDVTLAVGADQARQLAEARRSGEFDLVLLPPAPPSTPAP